MKLTYWKCDHKDGIENYAIRAETKREATEQRKGEEAYYEAPRKVVVEYRNGLDLLTQCKTDEGRNY